MLSWFGFVLQMIPIEEDNKLNNAYEYAVEEIVPRGTKEIPINLGPPGKKSYHGILHIYKTKSPKILSTCRTLVVLNIHASLPIKTIVSHLFPYWCVIEHIKVLKGEKMNRYSALIRFKTHTDATLCLQNFDGYTISDGVDNVLNLSFVHSLQITKSDNFVPPKHSIELPACPVCLEELDETVNGLMTVQCDHTFHRDCIYKWHDFNCPVCRLEQSPLNTGDQKCDICNSSESLWICLICGFIGCDRYNNRHSVIHYEETCHTFAKQVGGPKVWDYISDCYVQRIISNEGDNKLVEWESIPKCPDTHPSHQSLDLKLNHMEKEYLSLVAVQLETQKDFFTQKIDELIKQHQVEIKKITDDHKNEISNIMVKSNDTINNNLKELDLKIKNYESTIETYENDLAAKDHKIIQLNDQINPEKTDSFPNKLKAQDRAKTLLQKKIKELQNKLHDEEQLSQNIGVTQGEFADKIAAATSRQSRILIQLKNRNKVLEQQVKDLSIKLELVHTTYDKQ